MINFLLTVNYFLDWFGNQRQCSMYKALMSFVYLQNVRQWLRSEFFNENSMILDRTLVFTVIDGQVSRLLMLSEYIRLD